MKLNPGLRKKQEWHEEGKNSREDEEKALMKLSWMYKCTFMKCTNVHFKYKMKDDIFVKTQKTNHDIDLYNSSFDNTPNLLCSHWAAL